MNVRLILTNSRSTDFIKAVPHFFTLLNAFFGFLSIIKSLENDYVTAAYLIILAAIMDGFDGRLARKLGSTSGFGMELDSLSDAISFCLAPIILVYSWFPGDFSLLGIIILGIYVCTGILRLARFNTKASTSCLKHFIGLPTTLAAFCLACLILYAPWLSAHSAHYIFSQKGLCVIVFTLATLMISTIPFATFKQNTLRAIQKWCIAAALGCFIIGCTIGHYPCLLFLILGYIFFNFLSFIIKRS